MRARLHSLRQRGSILVPAALIILIGIILLGGAQLGYLYYMKRDLQKAADLAALTGAQVLENGSVLSCSSAKTAAIANITQNLGGKSSQMTAAADCYRWDANNSSLAPRFIRAVDTSKSERYNAVRVTASMPVSNLFPFTSARTIQVEAIAARPGDPVAAFWVGTTLAKTQSGTLTNLLKSVGLDVGGTALVGYDAGLANVKITPAGLLKQLGIEVPANISLGEFNQLLATNVRALGDVLNAVVTVAGRNELLAANVGLLNAIKAKLGVSDLNLKLGSNTPGAASALFANITGPDVTSALNVQLNALDVLATAIGVGTGNHAATVDQTVNLGLLKVATKVRVVEPPSIAIGGVGARAYTAQVRAYVLVTTPDSGLLSLLSGILKLSINLPITIDVVSGDGVLTKLCEAKDASNRDLATVQATSSLLRVCVGGPPAGAAANWPFGTDYHCGDGYAQQDLISLSVLNQSIAKVRTDKLQIPALPATGTGTFYAGQTQTLPAGGNPLAIGTTVKSVTDAVLAALVGNTLNNGSAVNQPELRKQLAQQIWDSTTTTCTADTRACRKDRLQAGLTQINNASNGLSGFLGGVTGSTLDLLGNLVTLNIGGLLNATGNLVTGLLSTVGGLLNGLLSAIGLDLSACTGILGSNAAGCVTELSNAMLNNANVPSLNNPPNVVVALVGMLVNLLKPALDSIGSAVLTPLINDLVGLKLGLTDVHMLSIDCNGKGVQLVY